MFNRINQFLLFFNKKINKNEIDLAKRILSKDEFLIFNSMNIYDKRHSLNILYDIEKSDISNDKLKKLALLHDCGKSIQTKSVERILFVLFKKLPFLNKIKFNNLENHELNGYNKLKDINNEIADLILIHHDKNSSNELIQIFLKFDDKN